MDPIDFDSVEENTIEVNGGHQLFGNTFFKYILLCSEKKKIIEVWTN